ncbi:hypothetical protein DYB28_003463 [Aphanomyces astaci]|uniref:Uncharacterized protein n=2 Tax=Aphanomyces astaci TaxID=112090 RepID=A0A9X8H9Q0_APHAT|nr:hypothetical protein DYB28_003463 [Aphanomyces astaci]
MSLDLSTVTALGVPVDPSIDTNPPVMPRGSTPGLLRRPITSGTSNAPSVDDIVTDPPHSTRGQLPVPTVSPPPNTSPTENVWEFMRESRRRADRASSKADIGTHRPTMPQLTPLLELLNSGASGGALFDAFEPLRLDVKKPVVCRVQMDTGSYTNTIDEGKAMKAVLFDTNQKSLEPSLAEIVQCHRDVANQNLTWGLASFEAMDRLVGVSFAIPVSRDGTKVNFTMSSPHVMDGFYLDIVDFVHDRVSERFLWEVLAAIGAPPIAGTYTQVSAAYGTKGSRYRLSFNDNHPPPPFVCNGRLLDEIVFLGKCHRIYGRGWYNHRKGFQRVDLDIAAKENAIAQPFTLSPSPLHARPAGVNKRQCVPPPTLPRWTRVPRGHGAVSRSGASASPQRPWQSPNMFDALREHIVVTPTQLVDSSTNNMLILPSILPVPDSPRTLPSNTYIDGTKPDGQSVTRATVSLDLMLEEFALLDSHVAAAKSAFTTMCSQPAASTSAFNLVDLVTTGAADRIQSLLSKHPMEFGLQVRSLASSTPVMLLHLTRLRMLCRWMRTTWGPSTPFATLYHNVFNHAYSIHALGLDITSVVRSSSLDEYHSDDVSDATVLLSHESESILALAEMLLGSLAPCYYAHDVALNAATSGPVFALPARSGDRYLASSTLCTVLLHSTLGTPIRKALCDLLQRARATLTDRGSADSEDSAVASTLADWVSNVDIMVALDQAFALPITPFCQVMFDSSTMSLTHGSLEDLWTDTVTPTTG